jgi:hypothetical protein
MNRARVEADVIDPAGIGAGFQARLEAQGVAKRAQHHPSPAADAAPRRSWSSRAVRVLGNAAVAVALLMTVPIALVVVRGDRFARILDGGGWNAAERVDFAERVRPVALESDPSITPAQAGLALNKIVHRTITVAGFEMIKPATRATFPWRTSAMAPDRFVTSRPDLFAGPSSPWSRSVLEATARGLSEPELQNLRVLASAPVWRDFDLVARAPAVDAIGGQFRLPFGEGTTAEQRPMPKYSEARELAYAAVSRASYHMAIGQRDSAETVLRSIVSFGFALIDNSSGGLDELIGIVIVGIGRDALQRFYVIQHDPRASMSALLAPPRAIIASTHPRGAHLSADDVRERLLARLENPHARRGDRFEAARALSFSPCTNVRDLILGPRAEVIDAVARASRTMPRYPSERALMELQTRPVVVSTGSISTGPLQTLAVSAASVPGALLGNPRLASCTLLLSGP